jgi:hypothetical protein
VIVMAMVIVSGGLVAWHGIVAMRVIMMLDRVTARIARMRAKYGDQPRQNSADQRQKDDCLNHLPR